MKLLLLRARLLFRNLLGIRDTRSIGLRAEIDRLKGRNSGRVLS